MQFKPLWEVGKSKGSMIVPSPDYDVYQGLCNHYCVDSNLVISDENWSKVSFKDNEKNSLRNYFLLSEFQRSRVPTDPSFLSEAVESCCLGLTTEASEFWNNTVCQQLLATTPCEIKLESQNVVNVVIAPSNFDMLSFYSKFLQSGNAFTSMYMVRRVSFQAFLFPDKATAVNSSEELLRFSSFLTELAILLAVKEIGSFKVNSSDALKFDVFSRDITIFILVDLPFNHLKDVEILEAPVVEFHQEVTSLPFLKHYYRKVRRDTFKVDLKVHSFQ